VHDLDPERDATPPKGALDNWERAVPLALRVLTAVVATAVVGVSLACKCPGLVPVGLTALYAISSVRR
jgi:hypothetical protein